MSCPALCNPMDCSMPGFPLPHCLLEFAQTHVHWVDHAIQSLHPLSYPFSCLQSFPTSGSFPVSQLFTWGGQNIGTSASASVLPLNIQGWFPLGLTSWVSLLSKALKNLLQHHKFKSINSLVLSLLYVPWLLEKRWFWLSEPLSTKWCLCCLGLP